MRAAFSESLVALAQKDPRVLLLTGDHGYALFDDFRKSCPQQYFNAGIAEQNMAGMAAGLAKAGYIPFVYGLSAFVPVRVLEQIKLDAAHDRLPVIFLGDGAGFVYSSLGTSHQSTEDIAVTRVIPSLTVLSPADRFEQKLCMKLAYEANTTVYLRMGKSDRGDIHTTEIDAPLGALLNVKQGKPGSPAFIATGSMVKTACEIAKAFYPDVSIWSTPSIKPIDTASVAAICQNSSVLVTLEEHSVYGGLGALVAEISSNTIPKRILRIGVEDRFSEFCGTYEYLLKEHGLDHLSVKGKIEHFFRSLNIV